MVSLAPPNVQSKLQRERTPRRIRGCVQVIELEQELEGQALQRTQATAAAGARELGLKAALAGAEAQCEELQVVAEEVDKVRAFAVEAEGWRAAAEELESLRAVAVELEALRAKAEEVDGLRAAAEEAEGLRAAAKKAVEIVATAAEATAQAQAR